MSNQPRFEVFPKHFNPTPYPAGNRTEFYWRFRAANGQISAVSGESFTRREGAHRAVRDFYDTMECFTQPEQTSEPPIIDVDD